jgi:hypothetical protein
VIGVAQVNVGMHEDVYSGQPPGQRRIANIRQAPGHTRHVTAVVVYRHHPADPGGDGERGGQGVAQPVRGPGDGHHRPGPRRRSPAGGLSDGRLGGGLSGVRPGGGRPPARCGPATAACGP